MKKKKKTEAPPSNEALLPDVAPAGSEVVQPTQSVEAFAERLMREGLDVPLNECFQEALDHAAYMMAVRNKSMVLGSRYLPGTVQAIGEKAREGNLEAAKLLFEFLGLKTKAPSTQLNAEFHMNVPTLRDVIEVDEEGRVIGVVTRECSS